jgi:single-strand DNA-binding protein
MNRVMLTGRLTRDPEMRTVSNGKTVTTFSIATNEYRGGQEKAEFHTIVTWDRLAEIAAQYLGKGQLVAIEGRLQTRQWEDERKLRHWKTEIVANQVEMLSGRKRKDHAAESAAEALAAQAAQLGVAPHELAASTLDQELDDDDLAGLTDDVATDEPVAVAA